MLDLSAPIEPGKRAAGIALGAPIAAVLRAAQPDSLTAEPVINTCLQAPTGITHYTAPAIELWEADGQVIQMRVRTGYRGAISGSAISLGATRAQISAAFGPLTLDDAGNPAICALPGLSFEFALPIHGQPPASAPLIAVSIFPPSPAV